MTESGSMREQIRQRLIDAFSGLDTVLAVWEGGSAAFGRADRWSDIDLQVLVRDDAVEQAQAAAEAALASIAPVERRFLVPQPSWHGHWQAFYRLEGIDPLLLADLCIMKESSPNRFLEPEIHGQALVCLDRVGLFPYPSTDAGPMAARLGGRLTALEERSIFQPFVEKELMRGRPVDAFAFYQSMVLQPLVEALRIRYAPWRYNFGMRYLQYDLPAEVYSQVEPLCFVAGSGEMEAKKAAALALLAVTLADLKEMDLTAHLEAHREK